MPLQSMTGFAREEGHHEHVGWVWELRSVNGKGLDIRLRLPSGFETIEISARKLISSRFKRGSIQGNLQITKTGAGAVPAVNKNALDAVLSAAESLRSKMGVNSLLLLNCWLSRAFLNWKNQPRMKAHGKLN